MSILPAHNSLVLLCLHNKAPWLDSTKKRGPTAFIRKAFNALQDWQIGSHITPLINSVEVLHTPSARHSLPFSNILLQDGDLYLVYRHSFTPLSNKGGQIVGYHGLNVVQVNGLPSLSSPPSFKEASEALTEAYFLKFNDTTITVLKSTEQDMEYINEIEKLTTSGFNARDEKDFKQALNFFEKALRLSRKINVRDQARIYLDAMSSFALGLAGTRKLGAAIYFYKKTLKLYREEGSHQDVVRTLVNLGVTSDFAQDYAASLNYFMEALDYSTKYHNEHETVIRNHLIKTHVILSNRHFAVDRPKAIYHIESILQLRKELYGKPEKDDSYYLYDLAFLHFEEDKFEKAIDYANTGLKIARELESVSDIIRALNQLAVLYLRHDECTNAHKYYMEAIAIVDLLLREQYVSNCPEIEELAFHSFNGGGNTSIKLENFYEAVMFYQSAEKFGMKVFQNDDPKLMALRESLKTAKLLAIYPTPEDIQKIDVALKRRQMDGLTNVAIGLADKGNPLQAISHFQTVLEYFREQNEHDAVIKTLLNIGLTYCDMSNFDEGINFFKQALGHNTKFSQNFLTEINEILLKTHTKAAATLFSSEHTLKVIDHMEAVIQLRRELYSEPEMDDAKLCFDLSTLYSKILNFDKANECVTNSLTISNKLKSHKDSLMYLNNLGFISVGQNNYESAIAYYNQAMAVCYDLLAVSAIEDMLHIGQLSVDSYYGLATVYLCQKDYGNAVSVYTTGLEIGERFLPKDHFQLNAIRENLKVASCLVMFEDAPEK